MPDRVANQILELLETERYALCTGDFIVLDALLEAKTQLFKSLESNSAAGESLKKIQDRVAENQSLLLAAINGVTAARNRLAALQNVRENLNTYDPTGRMALTPTKRPSMEKKA